MAHVADHYQSEDTSSHARSDFELYEYLVDNRLLDDVDCEYRKVTGLSESNLNVKKGSYLYLIRLHPL